MCDNAPTVSRDAVAGMVGESVLGGASHPVVQGGKAYWLPRGSAVQSMVLLV